MKLKTKLKLNNIKKSLLNGWYAAMKPVAKAIDICRKKKWDRFVNKVNSISEEEIVERLARTIIKYLTKYPKSYDDIHIVNTTDEWTERNIKNHMIDLSQGDKYVKQYGYCLKYDDIDTYRRLTELLYDRLSKEKELDVRWEVYDRASWCWKGYEKTLTVEVKKEYLD